MLESAVKALSSQNEQFYIVEQKSGTLRLSIREISYFKSDRRNIFAVQKNGEQVSFYEKLDEVESKLPDFFQRIHNRYLVNMNCISKVEGSSCVQKNGEQVSFYEKLDEVESKLPDFFQRIHNRYLVNMNCISKVEGSSCICSGEELPVSRAYKQSLAVAFAKTMLN